MPLKKFILFVVFTAVCSAEASIAANSNLVLGASLGYISQSERFTTGYTRPGLNLIVISPGPVGFINVPMPFYVDHAERISNQMFLLGLLAGSEWRQGKFLVGIEGNVDFIGNGHERPFVYTEAGTDVANTGSLLYDRGNIYALTVRTGYIVNRCFMPYFRLGAQVSRDEVNYDAGASGIFISPEQATFAVANIYRDSSSRKKDVFGIVLGLGAEFPIYFDCTSIRFEYNFVKTDSIIIEDNLLPIVGTHKFHHPESQIGKLSFVWKFARH